MKKLFRELTCLILITSCILGINGLSAVAQKKPYAGVTIEHWTFLNPDGDSPREKAIKVIFRNFEKETGMKVRVRTLPGLEIDDQLIATVAAGNPPDVSRTTVMWIRKLAKGGILMPLDQYANTTYTTEEKKDLAQYKTGIVDGKKYTFGLTLIPFAFYIRKDWIEDAGMEAPTTWYDFIKVGQALTTETRSGYLAGFSKASLQQVQEIFQTMIYGRGGQILDDGGKAVFNSKEGVQTYAFLRDLVHKYKILPEESIGLKYEDCTNAFQAGTAAMIVDGSHRYSRIANAVGKENILLAEVPSPSGMPPSPVVTVGWNICIPKGSPHPDAAWEFIKYWLSSETQLLYSQIGGGIPNRISVVKDDPYFQTAEAEHMRWWVKAVEKSGMGLLNPVKWDQLNETMTMAAQRLILYPELSVQEVLDEAVNTYNNL